MDEPARDLSPILTAHLFPQIEGRLIELLRSLSAEEWQAQTVSPRWKVKDVVAHLLDTQLRKLSLVRDGCVPEVPAAGSHFDLSALINRLNREGVAVYGRLSPPILIELMELTSRPFCGSISRATAAARVSCCARRIAGGWRRHPQSRRRAA